MKIGIFLCWREHLARDYFYTLLCVHERDVRASGENPEVAIEANRCYAQFLLQRIICITKFLIN